jgi:hypothetical protein
MQIRNSWKIIINDDYLPRAFWISVLSITRLSFPSLKPQLDGAYWTHSLWHLYLVKENKHRIIILIKIFNLKKHSSQGINHA